MSHKKTDRPRPAASRATPQPLMPPPMMARSKLSDTHAPRASAALSPAQTAARLWPASLRGKAYSVKSQLGGEALRLARSAAIAIGDLKLKRRTPGRVAQADDATVSVDQLLGHRKAKPRAALAGRALERLEEMGARLLGHTWTIVADFDGNPHPVAQCGDPDMTLHILLLLDGLHGIAGKIAQDAKELIAIRVNAQ